MRNVLKHSILILFLALLTLTPSRSIAQEAEEPAKEKFDAKSFIAHVTLMRSADLSHGMLAAPYVRTGRVDTITLFSSDLSADRPAYDPVCRVKLPEPLWGMQPLD